MKTFKTKQAAAVMFAEFFRIKLDIKHLSNNQVSGNGSIQEKQHYAPDAFLKPLKNLIFSKFSNDRKNVSRHYGGHYNIKTKHFEDFSGGEAL